MIKQINNFLIENKWLKKIEYIEHLASGEYNENFTVKTSDNKYVFRINHGSQLFIENQIEYEFNVLQSLSKSGVTPIPYHYDNEYLNGVMLMEFIEGEPLNYERDYPDAAFIFSKIHSQPVNDKLIKQLNPIDDISKESLKLIKLNTSTKYLHVRKRLLEYHDKLIILSSDNADAFKNEKPCIVNTEVNSNNFIISKERSCLVDWEKAVVSYPYQDLAHFLIPTTTLWKSDYKFGHDERIDFLRKYHELSESDLCFDEIIFKTMILEKTILLRALSWCYMAYDQYTDESKKITHFDTFKKIKSYLDNIECFLNSEI